MDGACGTAARGARRRRYTGFRFYRRTRAEPHRGRTPRLSSRGVTGRPSAMSLRIHNTLTRRLETFTPIEPGHVRMYVCGITVYDLCHMGHARMVMAFDVVYRWLRASGYRRHLRAQHHRHRGQDHQARARARHHDPRS